MESKKRDGRRAYEKAWRARNREKVRADNKAWREKNREKVSRDNKAWREKNKERCRAYDNQKRKRSPEKYRETRRLWNAARPEEAKARQRASDKAYRVRNLVQRRAYENRLSQTNPEHRLRKTLRARVYMAVKAVGGKKASGTMDLVGCTIPELRAHLETLFKPGMTWGNHGPVWHIDHKRPCASFDLRDPAQQRVCFHWSNQQPLFASENRTKGAS